MPDSFGKKDNGLTESACPTWKSSPTLSGLSPLAARRKLLTLIPIRRAISDIDTDCRAISARISWDTY